MAASPRRPAQWALYPDAERLRRLALKLEEKQLWPGHLSEHEHAIFHKALRSRDTWDAFLAGQGEPLDPPPKSLENGDPASSPSKLEDNAAEKAPDPVTTAFRVRAMLFEFSIRKLFPHGAKEDPMDFDLDDGVSGTGHQDVAKKQVQAREIEEDDYDDDEDDEPSSSMALQPPDSSNPDANSSMDTLDDTPPLPPIKSFPYDTYYHTLEHDRIAMLELQTVEELNRQNSTEGSSNATSSLQNVNFGAANLTLKHLLTKIEQKRDVVPLTDTELRKLLSDVRKNRSNSRWASDDLIGREELYEALESMLKKVMADKNSFPFLAKVRRATAPDYYNIIRRPMDLGTMQRNLKTGTYYKSKAQFMEELDLIWENCLVYNTDPNHILRPMAHAMRHLSATLAELVPDITIRTRAEVEAEEAAADAEDDVHSDTEEKPVKSSRKAGGFSSKGVSKKGASSMSRGPLHEELENKLLNGVREGSVAGSHDGRSASQVNGLYSTPPPAGTPTADMDTQLDPAQVAQQARDEKGDEGDEGDVLSKEWNAQTQQARAKYALHRHKLLRKPLGEDELGYIRTKKGMIKFKEWEDRVYDVVRFEEPVPEPDPEADDELPNEEDTEEDQFLAQYDLASGILNGLQKQYDEESLKELYSREAPSELSAVDTRVRPPQGLMDTMRENARKLGEIRKLCSKVALIRNMSQQIPGMFQPPAPPGKQPELDEFVWGVPLEGQDPPILPPPTEMSRELADYVMEQTVAKVLFHSGFEGPQSPSQSRADSADFQPFAFDVITNLTIEYMQTLGRTLTTYTNNLDRRKRFSEEEMILHMLDLNGVGNLEELDMYIKDDIERYGTKLEDCHRRLKRFLTELLACLIPISANVDQRPALQEGEDGTNLFEEQNESFVSGDFYDELGEDYFGFRELGLDKEFDMISLSVPLRLLQGRMRAAINPVSGEGGPTIQTEYPEPPPWDPVSADSLALEIGLIHAFFRDKFISVEGLYLIEDENLPIKQRPAKPRLPPTGKINTPRKRKDAPGHGGSSKKKKKPVVAAPVVKPEVVLITPPPDKEDEASENESLFVEGD